MSSSPFELDAADLIRSIIVSNWDVTITSVPVVQRIYDVGMAIDVSNADYVLIYEVVSGAPSYPYTTYQHVDMDYVVRVDIRTNSRDKLIKITHAVLDALYKKRVRPDPTQNVTWLELERPQDLSDRQKQLYRRVVDVRVHQVAVLLPSVV